MTYTTLPSYGKWQSDSSVLFAVRKDDKVLYRIDRLLEHDRLHCPYTNTGSHVGRALVKRILASN